MKSLTDVNGKLTELHGALDQVVKFLGKTQGEIVNLKVAVSGILGEAPVVQRRKRKARVSVAAQPNGPDGAVRSAPETMQKQPEDPESVQEASSTRKGGWPKGMKRGPRKAKQVPDQQEVAA